jgi:hypothetical protein
MKELPRASPRKGDRQQLNPSSTSRADRPPRGPESELIANPLEKTKVNAAAPEAAHGERAATLPRWSARL